MAEAGPTPHLPEDGRILSFEPGSLETPVVAEGAPLLVDVQLGRGPTLYALAQGEWDGQADGEPALPDTGSLVEANKDGTFTVIAEDLDRPTSFQVIGNTAYVITLGGEVWEIDGLDSHLTEPEEPSGQSAELYTDERVARRIERRVSAEGAHPPRGDECQQRHVRTLVRSRSFGWPDRIVDENNLNQVTECETFPLDVSYAPDIEIPRM